MKLLRSALFLVLVLLASCGGSPSVNKSNRYIEKKFRSKRNAIDVIRQKEAKLSDIPIPISSQPILEYCLYETQKPDEIMLGYSCGLSADELMKFFNQEMERSGWRYGAQFNGYEQLLQYEKPNRVCSISLRPKQNKTEVMIFAGIKKEYDRIAGNSPSA